ncbi:COQ9-domain-containing protein [Chaetomium strumarium]|uniref:Ubiquinone biosynthesis protein n=1 Tax=Chaetomium strumarium TaxID=1170767 RepID=A0AAJ0M1G5_9PEZI|nr:COQ9-domain-containing protein [Chaetomium strumarium]
MSSSALACFAGATTARRILLRPRWPTILPGTPSVAAPCRSSSACATRSIIITSQQCDLLPRPRQRQCEQQAIFFTPNRSYHSHDHPPPPGPFTHAEQNLLSAAYVHVPSHGFSQEALALGARDTGLLDISPSILPDGVFSLIRWHLYTQRTLLAAKAKDAVDQTAAVTVGDKVEALAWLRLRGNEAVVGRWQEALAIMAQPSYVPASLKELASLADEILYLAGDVSVDPSWYTKRASLSAIYAAAELFQTTDQSPKFRETRAFLRRRLDEAAQAGGALRSVGEWVGFNASAAVNVLRSKGVRI